MSPHIEAKKEDISNIVLMPGDPKRCEFIANTYLKDVKIINTIRNMSGYTGLYKDKKISIIPSGMGIPSAAIYVHELFVFYNVDTIIRIGTCGTFNNNVFDIILSKSATTTSTFASEYNNSNAKTAIPNDFLNEQIKKTAKEKNIQITEGNVFTTDSFYKQDISHQTIFDAIEMEAFALLHIAKTLNKKATAILTVSDIIGKNEEINCNQREKGLTQMIELALESILKL